MIYLYGWTAVVIAPLPLLVLVMAGLFAMRSNLRQSAG